MNVISIRTTTTIRTWNVRAMYETGKTAQIAAEMRRFNFSILGISKIKMDWAEKAGSWQRRLTTGELLVFIGHEQNGAPHARCGTDVVKDSPGRATWVGGSWPMGCNSLLMNKDEEDQLGRDPVLCPNE